MFCVKLPRSINFVPPEESQFIEWELANKMLIFHLPHLYYCSKQHDPLLWLQSIALNMVLHPLANVPLVD